MSGASVLEVEGSSAQHHLDGQAHLWMSGQGFPVQLDGIRDQAAVFHVDLDGDADRLRPVEDPGQIRHAGVAVHRLAQLGQFDGDRGVQLASGDCLGRRDVLLDGCRRASRIRDSLTEQVEDAADPVAVQVRRRIESLLEPLAGDEAVRGFARDRVLGNRLLETRIARHPQQRPSDHDASCVHPNPLCYPGPQGTKRF